MEAGAGRSGAMRLASAVTKNPRAIYQVMSELLYCLGLFPANGVPSGLQVLLCCHLSEWRQASELMML